MIGTETLTFLVEDNNWDINECLQYWKNGWVYNTSDTVFLENFTVRCYRLPVSGYVTVSVYRGDFDMGVLQFVSDGSGGSWKVCENYISITNPGTWSDTSGEIFHNPVTGDDLQSNYIDPSGGPVSHTFNLNVQTYDGNDRTLVCINKGYNTPTSTHSCFSGKLVVNYVSD